MWYNLATDYRNFETVISVAGVVSLGGKLYVHFLAFTGHTGCFYGDV